MKHSDIKGFKNNKNEVKNDNFISVDNLIEKLDLTQEDGLQKLQEIFQFDAYRGKEDELERIRSSSKTRYPLENSGGFRKGKG